jgi:hypothetical protein
MAEPDLNSIARQLERAIADVGNLKRERVATKADLLALKYDLTVRMGVASVAVERVRSGIASPAEARCGQRPRATRPRAQRA